MATLDGWVGGEWMPWVLNPWYRPPSEFEPGHTLNLARCRDCDVTWKIPWGRDAQCWLCAKFVYIDPD